VTATIHPYIKITEAGTHTPEFTMATASEDGLIGLNRAAKALAMTAYDLCTDPAAFQKVREEFENWKKHHTSEEA
jgi:hypothetical protein